ncbi:MAG: IS1595 family transposase [Desulfovibrio sp.]|uniref:IS1595 family transposase n=1 Tax=Desulfovibrio sp. TaxID=885 RepID=UPI00135D588C|nr:IS1595 family transposase [Desulfovibrio sp.]MTJ93947.1 IS1595 family transposase [Desulfovibrio sp.]
MLPTSTPSTSSTPQSPPAPFPTNFIEFHARFPNDEACRRYLLKLRWPTGFVCPACGTKQEPYDLGRDRLRCRVPECRAETTATAGTLFSSTRGPLLTWFLVMWEISSRKTGVSAVELQAKLGFSRYATVWIWLNKLRQVMVRPDRDRLAGEVEVGIVKVSGHGENGLRAFVAAQREGRRIGRIRLDTCEGDASADMIRFITETIRPGSTIIGQVASATADALRAIGYVVLMSEPVTSSATPRRVRLVGGHISKWLMGTHQGGVQKQHLGWYLDEYVFRFNRRSARSPGQLFQTLVKLAVQAAPRKAGPVSRSEEE